VEVGAEGCVIFRPGVITREQIEAVCGVPVALRGELRADEVARAAPAPGMGERHYAPRARLVLVEGEGRAQVEALAQAVRTSQSAGAAVGVLLADVFSEGVAGQEVKVYRWGRWEDAAELAQRLYAGLRWLDAAGVTVIVCPMPAAMGIGVAVRDRLLRAAGGREGSRE
ncbi:MAG: Sua5 family C-terminal domain-containing protein, partial [Acidobacteriota bacterium]